MKILTDDIVQETWEEVTELPPERARLAVPLAIVSQPELARFVREETGTLEPRAVRLAFPFFTTILRMFEKAAGSELSPVSAMGLEEAVSRRDKLFQGCGGKDEQSAAKKFVKNVGRCQPHVMLFLFQMLTLPSEDPADDEPLNEDTAKLFLTLVTVVIALDGALNPDDPVRARRG